MLCIQPTCSTAYLAAIVMRLMRGITQFSLCWAHCLWYRKWTSRSGTCAMLIKGDLYPTNGFAEHGF